MKNIEIDNEPLWFRFMEVNDFSRDLTNENFRYLESKYKSIEEALIDYKRELLKDDKGDYLSPNEYFDTKRNS